MSEQFSILIDSRTRFETSEPGGVWLSMPTTKEQLHEAMQRVGITADNPQDFLINGFMNTEQQPFDVPLPVIQSAGLDELNYLGNLLSMQRDEDRNKFTAAVTLGERAGNIKDLINLAQNLDCYWLYPTVQNEEDYGYYLIDELDELELPEEAKKYFMYEDYGRDAAINDGGRFTEQGYIYNNKNTFTEWYNGKESDIPREYKVMSFPQPERPDPSKVEMDAAAPGQKTAQTAEQPQEPRPVIPIVLTSEKPAEKLKEITDRLEQGITELFESERYREYLRVMSKFHNYSFNNTLLIAMQKPDASLVAGFSAWKNNFGRNVMKGQKGIKIIAPSPYKVKQEMKKIRMDMQIIFQDPYSSIDPRMTVSELIAEPIHVCHTLKHKDEIEAYVVELMRTVGLSERLINTYPHELDGGRRQRIGVARALALKPTFIVCDEPVSALDVSIQAQILNLMMDLQDDQSLTYMFISHDLSVVRHISDHIMVMYLGQCVESAPADELFENPRHPYTKALLEAIPVPSLDARDQEWSTIRGEVTSPVNPAPGCRFAARCPYATDQCRGHDIPYNTVSEGHNVACVLCN